MPEWITNAWGRFTSTTGQYIANILGAFVILILGWVVASLVRSLIAKALAKTGLDKRLSKWFGDEEAETKIEPAKWLSQGAYYLILVMVIIGFLETLRLKQISEPLNEMLAKVLDFAPNLLSAAVLLILAVVLARILKAVIAKVLTTMKVEERLAESAGMPEDKRPALTGPLSSAGYWLVLLLFLPTVLESLSLQGLLQPVLEMFGKVFDFIPNVLAAAIILVVGWFIAHIVEKIVTGLLSAANLDGLSEKLGINKLLGQQSISALIGLVVYVLILIPVIISSLNALKIDAVSQPATQMLTTSMDAIPNIFAACVILILATIVGKLVAGLITNVLGNIGFDLIFVKLGLSKEGQEGTRRPSEIAGIIALIYIILFAAIEAAGLLGFSSLESIMMTIAGISGRILFGLVIIALGIWTANLVANLVTQTGAPSAALLATVARIGIVVMVGAIGLREMGLANEIINTAFGLLLGAAAVAIAISFGLGGRDIAARQLESWTKSIKGEDQTPGA